MTSMGYEPPRKTMWSRVLKLGTTIALAVTLLLGNLGVKTASAAVDESKFIVDVAFGVYHSVALAKDGTLWAWGDGFMGQMGLGKETKKSNVPVKVSGIDQVTALEAGSYHTVALRKDGTVWVWGANVDGELGDGTYTSYSPPDASGASRVEVDRNAYKPQVVPNLSGIVGISATRGGVIAWDKDGHLWSWGDSFMGRPYQSMNVDVEKKKLLPVLNEKIKNVVFAAASGQQLAAIAGDGTVWTQGYNDYGQLGDGKKSTTSATVQVPEVSNAVRIELTSNTTIAFLSDGKVLEWGLGMLETKGLNPTDPALKDKMPVHLQPTATKELQGFSVVENTTYHFVDPSFLALKADGTVWTYGDNAIGQLGIAGVKERYSWAKVEGVPAAAVIEGAAALNAIVGKDGSLWTWGQNFTAQLGDGTTVKRSTPTAIGGFGSAPSEPVKETTPAAYEFMVNGKGITLSVKPELKGSSIAIPLSQVVKAYNAKLVWSKDKKTATVTRSKMKIILTLNSAQGSVNGKTVKLPFASQQKSDDWLVSADWLAKQLGGTAKLDTGKRILTVTLPK
ncbi:stalk domain-containing protein [Cohnella sp. WQ 127256]|uniref:stalk domain-containing protein n=1 Tax=Cohnella sp. WQ 127256 TaxID=2938790 RepID=UPI002119782E|nr:stalk domain-containing protein [Cohnella sp. WQ 127256]